MCPVSGSADHSTCSQRVLITNRLPAPWALIRHHGWVTITHRTLAPFARVAIAFVALATLLVAMAVTAPPASAHARLEASSPKDGSTLTATPPEVMLRFNEPIKSGLNQVSVTSGSTDATDGKLEVDGNTVYQPLKSTLDKGSYTVTYKVVSADGHPISGSLKFSYAPPAGDDGAGTQTGSSTSGSSDSTTGSSSGSSTPPPASSSASTTPSSSSSSSSSEGTSSSESTPTSTSSESTSSSTSATDGETAPAAPEGTSSSTTEPATSGDSSSGDGGVPMWVWVAGLGALLVIGAGIGFLTRGRRDPGEDEEIDLEEWRG